MGAKIIWHVENRSIAELTPHKENPRIFTEKGMKDLNKSINKIGMAQPINITPDGIILSGHARIEALKSQGVTEVDCYVPDRPLTDKEQKEILIRMNANTAGVWDDDKLIANFQIEDLDDWGLEVPEIVIDEKKEIVEDEVPEEVETRCKLGDLWKLGNHRLLCGDTTKKEDMQNLMDGKIANMIFTDPPYNVNYGATMKDNLRYHTGQKGARKIKNDNLGDNFYQFLVDSLTNMMSVNSGSVYVCMSSSELHNLYNAFVEAGGKWSTFIIWAKNTFTLGRSDYQRQYEPILYGWNADVKHYWCGDRKQSDIWEYNKPTKNDLHPTMKPVELVAKAVSNSSKHGELVLDGFGGSGTTLIACEQLGRSCNMMELDEHYCDVIIQRWENLTGKKAVLLKSTK